VVLTPQLLASSSRVAKATHGRRRQKSRSLREEHEISHKAIAQGRPGCFRRTCMLVCTFCFAQQHTGPRVRRAPGLPCALRCWGQTKCKPRANHVARTPLHIHMSSPRRRGPSIPETAMTGPRGRGVLDPRLRGDDEGGDPLLQRHCEERSDAAIHPSTGRHAETWIASLRSQ
jgi:hypothetical protein